MFNDQSSNPADPALKPAESRDELSKHDLNANSNKNPAPDIPSNLHGEASVTTIATRLLLKEAEEELEGEAKPEEAEKEQASEEQEGDKEEDVEDEEEDIYAELQEDEETRSYMPDYIEKRLNNPPPLLGVSSDEFRRIFDDIADCMSPHRPKSDLEFDAVYIASLATARLRWLDRQIANLVKINQRPAAEDLYLGLQAVVPSSKKDREDLMRDAKESAMDYFANPDHRKKFDAELDRGGFGAEAVETEAFKRAMPALSATERMRKSAMKERDQALKELKQAYSSRHPDQRMPLSRSAEWRFFKEVEEDKKLAREERLLEEAKKAAQNGDA